ncbi:MAG: hypothetical protein ACOY0T_11355 [Myxococcota bacterium]
MDTADVLGPGESLEDDDSVAAKDRPMEAHAVLVGSATSVVVLVVDERKRRLPNIPLCLVGSDGSTLEQSTDESGVACWDDVSHEQTWRLTCSELPTVMRREATLGLVKFEEDSAEPEDALELEDEGAYGDEERDEDENDNDATEDSMVVPGLRSGLSGSLGDALAGGSGTPKAGSESDDRGLLGAVGQVVEQAVDGLAGALKFDVSLSLGGGASDASDASGTSSSFSMSFGGGGFDSAGFGSASEDPNGESEDAPRVYPHDFDPQAGPTLSYVAFVERVKVKTGDSLDSLARAASITSSDLTHFNWGTDDWDEVQRKLRWEVGCATDGDHADDLVLDDYADPGVLYVPRALALPVEVGKRYKLRGKSIQPFFLVLKNRLDRPIPAAAYTLNFADGTSRAGTLGEHGIGLVENPPWGPVEVHYDDPNDLRAKALAGDARQAIQEMDTAALYEVMSGHPDELRAVIDTYDDYFNDFTGDGFVADVKAIVTDEDERIGMDLLLDRVGESLDGANT